MIYDPFQRKAIDYINENNSVIVSAPTGAGKTVIAEHVIHECLANGTKAVYTAPIKALSNQKFRDFQENFQDKIGILTGDVSINPEAPILIMTTEIFRNKILGAPRELEGYSWVIFDEIHYLDDYERGTVWEESIIFLPKHMKILGLSATIPNIDEFAEWIKNIHDKPLKVVKEATRPVPLHFLFQHLDRFYDHINQIHPSSFPSAKGRRRYHDQPKLKQNRLVTLISELTANKRMPCIYFAFGRKRCEFLPSELAGFNFLEPAERSRAEDYFDELCQKFDLKGEESTSNMRDLVTRGIAFHHAGMLPTLKEIVERIFTSGLIKIIFTTETFALGINMPARTVVFDELRKFYGTRFAPLRTRDFYQMAGRAGRRGMDKEGFVYTRINPRDISPPEIKRIIYSEPEKVRSRFNASYATILNLYEKYGEDLYDIYPRSFHYFQEKKHGHKRAIASMKTKVDFLKELGYIQEHALSPMGKFASNVYGYELAVTELYKQGILDHLSIVDLGTIFVALVYEPRKNASEPELSRRAKVLKQLTGDMMNRLRKMERRVGIYPESKEFYYNLTPAIEAWMQGAAFDEILKLTDVDEGEIIRNFRMCVQIFRELLDTHCSRELKDTVHKSILAISHGVVDAEKQLRTV
jgi:superfamily II RNA helicase